MKFKELREKVRGGKVDPLSKMGRSKLTGAEINRYYRDNPSAKKAAKDATVKKAIELALDLGGSMNYAMKEIEKLKRGLTKNKEVAKALKVANESVQEGKKLSPAAQEKLVDLFNKLMDVKHGGPEYKKIKKQIELIQMRG